MSKSHVAGQNTEIARLERKRESMKARVSELESRVFLSAAEQADIARLKKEKLLMKDAILTLRGR